jgi:adenosylhomocysteine nucleosidase
MLALIAAMDEELSDLRRFMTVTGVDERGGFVVYRCTHFGKQVLLVRSGVGRQRADRASRFLFDHYPVTAVVSFGFAGALNGSLRIGDVVACSSMICSDRSYGPRCSSDSALVSAARSCSEPGLSCGVGVTAPRLVASRSAKIALLETSEADIVDMESYWIGVVAAENGVPFVAVRSVSDSATDSLPDLPSWKWRHVVPHFALHPASAFSLYRGVSRARKRMSRFLMHMVEVVA